MVYTFVLMMKKRELDAEQQLIMAVNEDDVDIMYELIQDTVYEEYAQDYDFVCYTFYRGRLVEGALYDKEQEDFLGLMYYEEDDKE